MLCKEKEKEFIDIVMLKEYCLLKSGSIIKIAVEVRFYQCLLFLDQIRGVLVFDLQYLIILQSNSFILESMKNSNTWRNLVQKFFPIWLDQVWKNFHLKRHHLDFISYACSQSSKRIELPTINLKKRLLKHQKNQSQRNLYHLHL